MTLVHVRNTGVAFSLFSSGGTLVLVFTLIALAVLITYFVRRPEKPWLWLPVGMLIGGAIGNLIDRIANGAVTDFIKLPHWPAFNVADMSITFGVLVLLWVLEGPRAKASAEERERRDVSADSRIELRVPEQAAGTRLDRFLAAPLGSRARAQNLIDAGRVRVDGVLVPKRHLVAAGEAIEIDDARLSRAWCPTSRHRSTVAYEDEHLLVVDKPAGVVVHPARGHRAGTLAQALAGRAAGGEEPWRAGIVHRLDRDTSGLLVVAQERRGPPRPQVAAVPRAAAPRVPGPGRRSSARPDGDDRRADRARPPRPQAMSIDTDEPREARTHFELERLRASAALLRVALETDGRTRSVSICRDRPSGMRRPPVRHARPFRSDPSVPPRRPAGVRHPVTGEEIDVRLAAARGPGGGALEPSAAEAAGLRRTRCRPRYE